MGEGVVCVLFIILGRRSVSRRKFIWVLLPVDWTDKFLTFKLMSSSRRWKKMVRIKGRGVNLIFPTNTLWFKEVILRLVRINWDVFRSFPTWFILYVFKVPLLKIPTDAERNSLKIRFIINYEFASRKFAWWTKSKKLT